MKGLIKKDFLLVKSNIKVLVILFIVVGFMSFTFNGEMNISFVLPFMSVVIMLSTFSYDAYNKWDAYVTALPDGRKNSIKSKYIATIILLFMIAIGVSIITAISTYIKDNTLDFGAILEMVLVLLSTTIIMQSIMYPVIYKFGLEKARIGIFVGAFGLGFLASLISKYVDFKPIIQHLDMLNNYLTFILPIVTIILLYISYKISEKVYKNKEF